MLFRNEPRFVAFVLAARFNEVRSTIQVKACDLGMRAGVVSPVAISTCRHLQSDERTSGFHVQHRQLGRALAYGVAAQFSVSFHLMRFAVIRCPDLTDHVSQID